MSHLSWGVIGAVLVHGMMLLGLPAEKNPRYEVTVSPSSIEVSLVAVRPETVELDAEIPVPEPEKLAEDSRQQAAKKTLHKESSKKSPAVEDAANSLRGAFQHAVPMQRINQPPLYPRVARMNGYEGVAVLEITVDPEGRVSGIRIEQSSGHEILDNSAVQAIQTWKFESAKRLGIAVRSTVIVPVRFRLEK